MPNRLLREGILTSERVEKLNWAEEVFYRRLMSVVDDFGRYYARPALLLAACYPLLLKKVSDSDIEKWLSACENAALVRVYPAEDGKRYLQMLDFKQQVRAINSKFPPPLDVCAADATQALNGQLASAHLDVVGVVVVDEKTAGSAFVPPEWVPHETWGAYLKVRLSKRAKNEPHALGLIVKDLEKFRAAGHDPVEVLNNSIKSSWVGVFEPKGVSKFPDKADVARQTVATNPDVAATAARLAADAAIPRNGPSPAVQAKLVALRNGVPA